MKKDENDYLSLISIYAFRYITNFVVMKQKYTEDKKPTKHYYSFVRIRNS